MPTPDVDARIDDLEREIARLRNTHDALETAKTALPRPPGRQSQSAIFKACEEANERARQARNAAAARAEEAYERRRLADAHSRGKLEQQAKELDDEMAAIRERQDELQREHDEIGRRRLAIHLELGAKERSYRAP